jgi:hypothetical protein
VPWHARGRMGPSGASAKPRDQGMCPGRMGRTLYIGLLGEAEPERSANDASEERQRTAAGCGAGT